MESAFIHTFRYISTFSFGYKNGLIIPGFWVRIPEGPPGFSTGQAICLACFLFHGSSFHLQIACLLTSGRPLSTARDAAATKPAHLLRLSPTPRPYPVFRENRRPSTCDFIFARGAMVGGCRPNVVDGPVSWREAPGAGGVEPDGRAAAAPPSRGARPVGLVGHRGPIALESVPHPRRRPRKVFPKLSLHRRGSSRIVLFRTGA